MFAIAFIVALIFIVNEAKRRKIEEKHIYNIALLSLIGTIIGARLFYVVEHLSHFLERPLEILMIWQGGLTSYGAFLSLLFVWLYVKKQKISFGQILDLIAPYLLLAIAITRIGCFLNWDDYGKITSVPWAIKVGNETRHPTQLYESLYALIGFFVVKKFGKVKKDKKEGNLFLLSLMFYSFFRFFNDFLREYEIVFGLALSQWLCFLIFIIAALLFSRNKFSVCSRFSRE